MKQNVPSKVQETFESISKVKMMLIINKDLYDCRCISLEKYKIVEDKLVSKLTKLESLVNIQECEV